MTVYNVNSTGNPSADGATFLSVLAGTVSGDLVNISAGTFDVGPTAPQIVVPNGVAITGAGIDVTYITSDFFGGIHASFKIPSNATVQGFTFTNLSGTGPFGSGALDANVTNGDVRNVKIIGQGDGVRWFRPSSTVTFTNCTIIVTDSGTTGADAITGGGTNTILTFVNCTVIVNAGAQAGRGIAASASGMVTTMTGGSITLIVTGGTAGHTYQGVSITNGTAILNGVTITVTGNGVTTKDLITTGNGKISTFNSTFNAGNISGNITAVTWATPASIPQDRPLSATQLNAVVTIYGAGTTTTSAYSPASGTYLSPGTQTLSVTVTPTDTTHYAAITGTVQLVVNPVTPPLIVSATLDFDHLLSAEVDFDRLLQATVDFMANTSDIELNRVNIGSTPRFEFSITKDGATWDLSSPSASVQMVMEKPDRSTTLTKTMTALNTGSDGIFYYDALTTDIDTTGFWTITLVVTDGSIVMTYPDSISFRATSRPAP